MSLYSVKMRAWRDEGAVQVHISGAERLVPKENVAACLSALQVRAFQHEKGMPTGVNFKVEAVNEAEILHIPELPTSRYDAADVHDGLAHMEEVLSKEGIPNAKFLVDLLTHSEPMRGAIIWGLRQGRRLEADHQRGVRVTYMDYSGNDVQMASQKNHYREALALASKVLHHPNIKAEICISDDPGYVTGYVATKSVGYHRITCLKEMGSPRGGRVFVFDGEENELADCVAYLEKKKVLIDESLKS